MIVGWKNIGVFKFGGFDCFNVKLIQPKASKREEMMTVFEKVISGEYEGSFVYQDEVCVAFMDLNPINEGHVLVVPRTPVARLSDLDSKIASHLFSAAQRVLKAIEESDVRCEGANLFLSDGEIAGQEVPHVHLHIVPRYSGDGVTISFGKPFAKVARNDLNDAASRIASQLR